MDSTLDTEWSSIGNQMELKNTNDSYEVVPYKSRPTEANASTYKDCNITGEGYQGARLKVKGPKALDHSM